MYHLLDTLFTYPQLPQAAPVGRPVLDAMLYPALTTQMLVPAMKTQCSVVAMFLRTHHVLRTVRLFWQDM